LFNLPGFHGSEPVITALLDAYVARIEDGFQEFKIDKDAILIGNGFGGALALAFALDHPERVGKLVLSGAAAAFPDEGRKAFAAMAQKAAEKGLGAVAEIAAARVHSPDYLGAHPELIEQRRRALLGIETKAFIDACKLLRELDLTPLLHRLNVPTLVVCGEFDQATPPALTKAVADKIPGARYVELKGCGHCPPLEQPQEFVAAIKEFVGL
jgi:pimeloyl-ACP methyl ester carboxylesterase